METSQHIRGWLAASGWSQAELARRVGLSPTAISRFLSGERELSRPFALAIEHATTDAFRTGEVSVAPLRASDLIPVAEAD